MTKCYVVIAIDFAGQWNVSKVYLDEALADIHAERLTDNNSGTVHAVVIESTLQFKVKPACLCDGTGWYENNAETHACPKCNPKGE